MIKTFKEFIHNLWSLLCPYWRSEERWVSGAQLAGAMGLNMGKIYLSVLLNEWSRLFFNALQERNKEEFIYQIYYLLGIAVIGLIAASYEAYLCQRVEIRWRRWLSERYISQWLQSKAYYQLRFVPQTVDNPDQRIAEDLRKFPILTINMIFGFVESVGSLGAFAVILWGLSDLYQVAGVSIPGFMLWVAIVYSLGGSWITHLIGRPLIGFNREQEQYEADYRFFLIRTRENAKEIAVCGGEVAEKVNLAHKFTRIADNWKNIILRQRRLNYFTFGYNHVSSIFPYLLVAPRYFAGAFQMGEMMQSVSAFGGVRSSLSWFINSYKEVAAWKATVDRLIGFEKDLVKAIELKDKQGIYLQGAAKDGIRLEGVDLYLPDNRGLLKNGNVLIPAKGWTLLAGPSGCGKSTLFHAISGVWPYFKGKITIPQEAKILYLPQKPYLPIATLRRTMTYPDITDVYDDTLLQEVLVACGLSHLCDRLHTKQHWEQELSPGEQQRLAFARALIQRPNWLFLDEASSALDEKSEHEIQRLLKERLPETTVVSIAHKLVGTGVYDRCIRFEELQASSEQENCAI